jgi:hypothetical protein
MVVLKRRSRLVTFRVSAEEYDDLTRSCVQCGARSVADFARAAVLLKVQMLRTPAGNLSGDLTTLSKGLRDLDLILDDMRKRIHRVLGPGNSALSAGSEETAMRSEE